MLKQIKVLVVDDSAFMRRVLTGILERDPAIKVVGTARDGIDALAKVEKLAPDVVTLDVEMPRLDGLATLKKLMRVHPLPVVMLSSLTREGSRETLEALSLGAVDFVSKPSGAISLDIEKVEEEIREKVKVAASARVAVVRGGASPGSVRPPGLAHRLYGPGQAPVARIQAPGKFSSRPPKPEPGTGAGSRQEARTLVIIGSSTGGPKALESVMGEMPAGLRAAVLIVQHMPAGFTRSLAERLDQLCPLRVKEAEEGDALYEGQVLVAPGNYHMVVNGTRRVHLTQEPPVNYVRPSVDVTMLSAAELFRRRLIGVILTGMGHDGAEGMARIKQVGGTTIAQDRETSTIYSMPRAVAENGDADYVLPVNRIGAAVGRLVEHLMLT